MRRLLQGAKGPDGSQERDGYLSVKAAAELASVAGSTIRAWTKAGRLSAYHAGSRLRVRRAELEQLLAAEPSHEDGGGDLTPEEEADRFLARRRNARG
jgi:excisionase family DNA binding protein